MTDATYTLDDIDLKIIGILRGNGRAGNRDIAQAVGISEGTVRSRIRRLYDTDTMRVVAITDVAAEGNEFFVVVWIQVEDRPVRNVANDVAGLRETLSVSLVSGVFDIVATAAARDKHHLLVLLADQLGTIDGVLSIECSVALDIVYSSPEWMAPTP